MLLSEVGKTINIKKILHKKYNKHFNKISSTSKEVDKKQFLLLTQKKKLKENISMKQLKVKFLQ